MSAAELWAATERQQAHTVRIAQLRVRAAVVPEYCTPGELAQTQSSLEVFNGSSESPMSQLFSLTGTPPPVVDNLRGRRPSNITLDPGWSLRVGHDQSEFWAVGRKSAKLMRI